MTGDALQHTHLDGIADYTLALDTLCQLAQHDLYLFEMDYDGLSFNSESRYETLRHFLLANPANRLFVLAQDAHYLSTRCPRMMMLLRQFDNRMFIHQTTSRHPITAPFCVADNTHYVRRFHFDDPHGLMALNDPENARALESRYMEIWEDSRPAISITKLGL
ncbi:MAG: hypothetical protein Q7U78_15140 [Gallionella sp.]|nr:hypothetical protein [Gallionella sp.]